MIIKSVIIKANGSVDRIGLFMKASARRRKKKRGTAQLDKAEARVLMTKQPPNRGATKLSSGDAFRDGKLAGAGRTGRRAVDGGARGDDKTRELDLPEPGVDVAMVASDDIDVETVAARGA